MRREHVWPQGGSFVPKRCREAIRGGNYEREHRFGASRLRRGSPRLLLHPSRVCEGVRRVRREHGRPGVAPGRGGRGSHELQGQGRLLRDPGSRAEGEPCPLHGLPALRDELHAAERPQRGRLRREPARGRAHPRARRLPVRRGLGHLRRHVLLLRVAGPRVPRSRTARARSTRRSAWAAAPASPAARGTCPW